jgi:predicted nucleic acid-binding Zn ribbon protein
MNKNFYNCEFCGVGIAVIQIISGGNEGQFKACGACLKLYIDEEAVKNQHHKIILS